MFNGTVLAPLSEDGPIVFSGLNGSGLSESYANRTVRAIANDHIWHVA